MAGDNTVSVEFIAETAQMMQGFRQVESGLAGTQAAASSFTKEAGAATTSTVNWTAVQERHAQAAEFMAQTNYKTAASFKPATAEMRAASIATEEVTEATRGFGSSMVGTLGTMVRYTAAAAVIGAVAEGVKELVTESMDLESAEVRFKSLAGNTQAASVAFEGLKQAAEDTHISVVDLSKASQTLLEAGVGMKDIPDTITQMGKNAQAAGVEVGELANALLRTSRGEVGPRDIATATRLTGDETGRLQGMYKDISVTIPNIAKGMEQTQRAQERIRQDADRLATRGTEDVNLVATRNIADMDKMITRVTSDLDKLTGARTSFGEAHGGADIFKAFQTGGSVSSLAGMHGGGQAAIATVMTQLREGVAQIGKEQGVDAMQLVREGVIGNEEVLAAGGRAREVRETEASRGREDANLGASRGREDKDRGASRGREDAGTTESRADQDARTDLESRKETERLQLVREVRRELEGDPDSEISKIDTQRRYDAYLGTARGRADKFFYENQAAASHAGDFVREGGAQVQDIDATSMQFGVPGASAPGAKAQTSVEDANWTQRLYGMAPSKAQQLGMSEESAKILIQQVALSNSHLQTIAQAFGG